MPRSRSIVVPPILLRGLYSNLRHVCREEASIPLANFLAQCSFSNIVKKKQHSPGLVDRHLSRRQRQILESLYELGEASAEEIRAHMTSAPSNSAVRATLKIMEDRGAVVRKEKGMRYVYRPSQAREAAQTSEVQRLVRTFFNNSVTQAMVALLGSTKERLSPEELDRIREMIDRAEQKD